MERQRIFKLLAASGAALALQGCIAAAFPIAAGGLLAGGAKTGEAAESNPRVESNDAAQVATVAPEQTSPPPEPAQVAVEEEAKLTSTGARDSGTFAVRAEPEVIASDPAADQSAATDSEPATAGVTLFDPLYRYVASPEIFGAEDRTSAMLSNATSLEANRVQCTDGPPTVLIDLDPKEGTLFPIDAGTASPALAEQLVQLRAQGVLIAWISNSPAERESVVRAALFRSGLDQLGRDRLLLVSAPDQRKQMLREQLAETSCIVAIAGDERSDFHELFGYLLNPSDAVGLEPIIGEGWFLIPTPLLPERAQ